MQARRVTLVLLAVFGIVLWGACAQPAPVPAPAPGSSDDGIIPPRAWMDIELTDVATGEKFKISDFKGKPILLESFAVWCPTCLAQQRQVAQVKERAGDAIVHISLDTDPNEDEARIKEHIERNGLDWYFAVSPIELTQALIDDFGLQMVNAPGAPVVLICEDQSTRFLRSGVKSADDLLSEIEKGCK